MKPFDDKFADNVRQVFDSYNEDVDPAAFADMQQRLKKQKKSRIIAFLPLRTLAAAAVALLMIVAAWQFFRYETGRIDLVQQKPESLQNNPRAIARDSNETIPEKSPSSETEKAVVEAPIVKERVVLAEVTTAEETPLIAEQKQIVSAETEKDKLSTDPDVSQQADPDPNVVLPKLKNGNNNQSGLLAANGSDPFEEFEESNPDMHLWSVSAGSGMAFSGPQVSDGLGVAAGVLSEWKVSPVVSLAVGGLLVYQQFAVSDYGGGSTDFLYAPQASEDANVEYSGENEYEMVALDIPLNAYFNVMETKRRRLFLGVGFSSILFLQESFYGMNTAYINENLQNPETGEWESQFSSETFYVDERYMAFSHFDFAKQMNFSAGYVIKNDHGSFVIEPYYKHPLGDITSRRIRLGIGGVSLRYNFGK